MSASSGLTVQLTGTVPRFGSSQMSRIRRWQYWTLSPSPTVSVTYTRLWSSVPFGRGRTRSEIFAGVPACTVPFM